MRRLPDLDLRGRRRLPWPALLVSLVVHAILLLSLKINGHWPEPLPLDHVIVLAPPGPSVPAVEMRYAPRRGAAPALPSPRPERTATAPVERPAAPPAAGPAAAIPAVGGAAPSDTIDPASPAFGQVGPAYASGNLWVRALPLAPKELASRLDKSHAELMDSAVTAIVQAFLDSIANSREGREAQLPSWTTKVAGKTFGIDSRYIHIAGLRIPAAVLALLPLPAGGNQQNALQHGMDLRRDLMQAAQRASNTAEFKEQIREIRERREREREFEKAQHEAPPPENPPIP